MSRWALVILTAVSLGGCLPSFAIDGNSDGGASTGGSTGGSNGGGGRDASAANLDLSTPPDLAIDPVAEFVAKVQPILTTSCAACHNKMGGIGPGFLAPDMLTTMLAYPGLINTTPDGSRIYVKGAHEGPALSPVDKPVVADWITLWASTRPKTNDGGVAKPAIKPFAPSMGQNTIDLSVLDPSLAGQKITFTASMVGTSLKLSQITIVAAPAMGVHLVHPLWVTWDAMMSPTPDPVDSFSNLDETVFGGSSSPMGPGTLLLPSFASNMQLNVVFSTAEPKMGTNDGGTLLLGCKSVTTWTSDAKPGLMASCTSCHGGANGTATSAYNLTAANGDTQGCANSRGEVDPATPANSRLFTYPDPAKSGNGHPFHFPDTATYTTFMNDVGMWIANEK
jgi:hypothetical protein